MTSPTPVAEITVARPHAQPIDSPLDAVVTYGILGLLIFAPLAFGAVEPWSIFVLQVGAVLLFLVWAIGQRSAEEIRVHWNPLFAPALAFAALVGIQFASGRSAYRAATSAALLLYACYGILGFLLIQCLRRRKQIENFALGLSILGTAIALFAVVQDFTSNGKLYWLRTPSNGGWIFGPYVNHNHYAGLMEMLAPIPLVVCFSRASRARKILAAFAAAWMASTIFLCGSRGGMVALGGQLVIAGIFLLWHNRNRKPVLAFAVFVAIMLGLLSWLGSTEVLDRIVSVHQEAHTELSGGIRLGIDRDAMKMFTRRPVMGWGLGTFPVIYPQFRSFYTNHVIDHAHNDYVELLTETGSLGIAILAWFLYVVFRSAARKLKDGPKDVNALVALAALLGISGILIHSLVDFNLQIPANALLFYLLCTVASMKHQFGVRKRQARSHHWAASELEAVAEPTLP